MQSFSYESNAPILAGMAFVNTKKHAPGRLLHSLRGTSARRTHSRRYLLSLF